MIVIMNVDVSCPQLCVLPPTLPPPQSINLLLELPEMGILEAISFLVLRVTVFSIGDKPFSSQGCSVCY